MRLSCGGSSVYPEGVAGDILQVPRDLEAGQVGNEGSSSHYNTKLRCHSSCSSSRLAQVFLTLKDSNISLILSMLSRGRPACIWCEFRIIPRYFMTVSGLMVLFLLGEHWAYWIAWYWSICQEIWTMYRKNVVKDMKNKFYSIAILAIKQTIRENLSKDLWLERHP